MPFSTLIINPSTTNRKSGVRRILEGTLGASCLIMLNTWVLPKIGLSLGLLGYAAVIVYIGHMLSGVYELLFGKSWQVLEDRWQSLTGKGRLGWGTVIVTVACVLLGLSIYLFVFFVLPIISSITGS